MDIETPKPFACTANGCGMGFTNEDHLTVHEKRHEMMLQVGLGQKLNNIFIADQTPTPTRLIKNCEEVGLFDELPNVNPFEETFRRAIEQKDQNSAIAATQNAENSKPYEDSLHTPQVYPQPENIEESFKICHAIDSVLSTPTLTVEQDSSIAAVYCTQKQYENVTKDISVTEKSKYLNINNSKLSSVEMNSKSQLIKHEVITLSFPATSTTTSAGTGAIPVQTVKPFILPKIETASLGSNLYASQSITAVEPSSASLTPTSQLPIKERLKAILNSSNKSKVVETSQKPLHRNTKKPASERTNKVYSGKYDEDCMERRRAAATRYRNKMKTEHFNLRRKNEELQNENKKLKDHVKELQILLEGLQRTTGDTKTNVTTAGPTEIQIPPSKVRLVMNIPKVVIHPNGQPEIKNPITFTLE